MEWKILDIIALAVLALGVADDLRSRKIHNVLVFPALGVCFIAGTYQNGWLAPLLSFAVAMFAALSLYKFKVWGGGDAKMYMALSPLLFVNETLVYLMWCFVWGGALALIQGAMNGRLTSMATNLGVVLAHRKGVEEKHLVKVPFSVGLFFGYLALMTWRVTGGAA